MISISIKEYLLITFLIFTINLRAQTGNEEISMDTTRITDSNSFWTQNRLTGTWNGARQKLWQNGIAIRPSFSNFYQGMISGNGNKDFEFGSKLGVHLVLNGEKLGLWKGFFTIARMEYNMGHSVKALFTYLLLN